MAFNPDTRTQLMLSLLSWALLLVIFFATKRIRDKAPAEAPAAAETGDAQRVLVLANETVEGDELIEELRRIDAAGKAEYLICVPANPIDTGQAMHAGAVYLWDKTTEAAQARLDRTLEVLQTDEPPGQRAARRLPAAAGAGQRRAGVPSGPAGDLHPPGGPVGLAALRRGGPGSGDVPESAGHPRRGRARGSAGLT